MIFCYPMFLVIKEFIKSNFKSKKNIFDSNIFAKVLGISLAICVSYIAGHVLLFPGVSIIFAIAFVSILDNTKKEMTK